MTVNEQRINDQLGENPRSTGPERTNTVKGVEMRNSIVREDLVYDVGMHQGEDTEYYLKKGFSVVGFEADPDLAAKCRKKFSNQIRQNKLIIVEGAIIEVSPTRREQGKVKFFKNTDTSVWGTVSPEWASRNAALGSQSVILEVEPVDFASCLERFGMPYYMKIDIEGADRICLESLRQFSQRPKYLSIESEKVDFKNLEQELLLLEELGYNGFKAVQQENITEQSPPKPATEGNFVPHTFQLGSSGLFGKELPGTWKTKPEILHEYRRIFRNYRWFGDSSRLRQSPPGQLLIRLMSRALGKPIPGWYDTHARHWSGVQS